MCEAGVWETWKEQRQASLGQRWRTGRVADEDQTEYRKTKTGEGTGEWTGEWTRVVWSGEEVEWCGRCLRVPCATHPRLGWALLKYGPRFISLQRRTRVTTSCGCPDHPDASTSQPTSGFNVWDRSGLQPLHASPAPALPRPALPAVASSSTGRGAPTWPPYSSPGWASPSPPMRPICASSAAASQRPRRGHRPRASRSGSAAPGRRWPTIQHLQRPSDIQRACIFGFNRPRFAKSSRLGPRIQLTRNRHGNTLAPSEQANGQAGVKEHQHCHLVGVSAW